MQIKIDSDIATIYRDNYMGKYSYFRLIFIFVLGLTYFIYRQASPLLIGAYVFAFILLVVGSVYLNKNNVPKKVFTIKFDKTLQIYKINNEAALIKLPINNKIKKLDIECLDWQRTPLHESLSIRTIKENLMYQLNGYPRNPSFKEDEVKQLAKFLGTKLK
jgi:hypothetical protein